MQVTDSFISSCSHGLTLDGNAKIVGLAPAVRPPVRISHLICDCSVHTTLPTHSSCGMKPNLVCRGARARSGLAWRPCWFVIHTLAHAQVPHTPSNLGPRASQLEAQTCAMSSVASGYPGPAVRPSDLADSHPSGCLGWPGTRRTRRDGRRQRRSDDHGKPGHARLGAKCGQRIF